MRFLVIALALALSVGCKSKSKEKEAPAKKTAPAPDVSTPKGAALCLSAGIANKNPAAITQCFHPAVRARVEASMRPRKIDWVKMKGDSEIFAAAKPEAFKVEPAAEDMSHLGDKTARLRVGDGPDEFLAVHKDGKWYVLDTGL